MIISMFNLFIYLSHIFTFWICIESLFFKFNTIVLIYAHKRRHRLLYILYNEVVIIHLLPMFIY